MSPAIDTGKVTERRKLRFQSLDELSAEIDRIVKADAAGRLRTTGNWTAGQVFGHLASWINYGWDGYPFPTPPWFVRFFLKFMRKKYLRDGMPAGVKIPNADHGTYGTEKLTTVEGAERLRMAVRRLKDGEEPLHHSPAFGPMSRDERIALNLRHAELHLSFLDPQA
jgi:hypothetical protein